MPSLFEVQSRRVLKEIFEALKENPNLPGCYVLCDGGHLMPEVIRELETFGIKSTITTKNYVSWANEHN